MQKYLYILCEGELDEMFYERIAERVTGCTFETNFEYRVRPGSNDKTVIKTARYLLNKIKSWASTQDIAVIIALDNDRAPDHPGGRTYPRPLPKVDLKKEARHPKLVAMLEESLGKDRSAWPVDVALAVPVEMIESWVLTLLDPNREELPPFSEAKSSLTRQYYPNTPPPQLKDLRDAEAKARGQTRDDLFWGAADADLEAGAAASPSLRLFIEELQAWNDDGAAQ